MERRAVSVGSSGWFLEMSSNRSRMSARWAATMKHSTWPFPLWRPAAPTLLEHPLSTMMADCSQTETSARTNEIRRFRPPRSERSSPASLLRGAAENRRGLRSSRLSRLPYRRASRDAARPRGFAQRVSRRRRPAHTKTALRSPGLYASPPPPAAPGGRDLHARPAQQGTLRARCRARHLADRDRVLRGRSCSPAEDLSRDPADPAPGIDPPDADLSRRVLRLCRHSDGARAVPEAASAVLVRRGHARRRRERGPNRLQHGGEFADRGGGAG